MLRPIEVGDFLSPTKQVDNWSRLAVFAIVENNQVLRVIGDRAEYVSSKAWRPWVRVVSIRID
jgi:hypothetical protein